MDEGHVQPLRDVIFPSCPPDFLFFLDGEKFAHGGERFGHGGEKHERKRPLTKKKKQRMRKQEIMEQY